MVARVTKFLVAATVGGCAPHVTAPVAMVPPPASCPTVAVDVPPPAQRRALVGVLEQDLTTATRQAQRLVRDPRADVHQLALVARLHHEAAAALRRARAAHTPTPAALGEAARSTAAFGAATRAVGK